MPIKPWIATCIQTLNHVVNDASTREEAMAIVNRSLDRWELFIRSAVGRGGEGPSQGGQHLFGDDKPFEVGVLTAAILLWPGHADESGGRSAFAELGIEGRP